MHRKVSELQRVLGQAAKEEAGRTFHSLYDKICRKEVIWTAWLQVKANGGSGGVDGKELSDYVEGEERNNLLREIHQELLEGAYHPQPVRREYIDKPDGGKRPLGIPTVADRIAQMRSNVDAISRKTTCFVGERSISMPPILTGGNWGSVTWPPGISSSGPSCM